MHIVVATNSQNKNLTQKCSPSIPIWIKFIHLKPKHVWEHFIQVQTVKDITAVYQSVFLDPLQRQRITQKIQFLKNNANKKFNFPPPENWPIAYPFGTCFYSVLFIICVLTLKKTWLSVCMTMNTFNLNQRKKEKTCNLKLNTNQPKRSISSSFFNIGNFELVFTRIHVHSVLSRHAVQTWAIWYVNKNAKMFKFQWVRSYICIVISI